MSSLHKLDKYKRRKSAPLPHSLPLEYDRRRSMSGTFQRIFGKKKGYSFIKDDQVYSPELYSICNLEESHVNSGVSLESPRIWRVRHRNSMSESLMEDLALETLQEDYSSMKTTKNTRKAIIHAGNHVFITCKDKFDVVGLFKDFIMYQYIDGGSNSDGRNLVLKRFIPLCNYSDDQRHLNERGAVRSRSNSDSNTCCSCSTASPASSQTASRASSRRNSIDDMSDVNTSYWDLCIPDGHDKFTAANRRNSWSPGVATFPKSGFMSRVITKQLHYTDMLNAHISKSNSKLSSNFERECRVTPKVQRHMEKPGKPTVVRKRSRSETNTGLSKDHQISLQRSRSVDLSQRQRNFRRSRYSNSLVRHIPFSDIEGSDTSDIERTKSIESSLSSSRRGSHGGSSSSSIELCSSSSEDKDSGYQKTDECNEDNNIVDRNETTDINVSPHDIDDIENLTNVNVNSCIRKERAHKSKDEDKELDAYINQDVNMYTSDGKVSKGGGKDTNKKQTYVNEMPFDGQFIGDKSKNDNERQDEHENLADVNEPNVNTEQKNANENRTDVNVKALDCKFRVDSSTDVNTNKSSITINNHDGELRADEFIDANDRDGAIENQKDVNQNSSDCNHMLFGSKKVHMNEFDATIGNTNSVDKGAEQSKKDAEGIENHKKQNTDMNFENHNALIKGNIPLEFKSMTVSDLLFCSGRRSSHEGQDDVNEVFQAINEEAGKLENKDKDMIVMFLVGGEIKVLRRSAGASGHGDRIRSDIPSMTRQDFPQFNGNNDHVFRTQPTSDYKRPRPKSEIIIGRSQSFAGMAEPSPQKKPSQGAMVLGESFRHHRGATMPVPKSVPVGHGKGAVGVSFRKSPKVPKVPRPNRALLMFQSVKRGIREFIDATKEDIEDLQSRDLDGTSTAQGRLHETDKQLKSAERYLKRLEFHLSKLDELHEYYMVQQQLREGVRTMHKAYVTSPGNQRNTLSSVKYGYKECTQTMCNIEAQLESMMGTFNCKLKGIAGFARLCPGDVFEVTTRHGTQKWKTKGRIEKSGNQKWDIPEYNFKAVVGDIINIKGVEVRAFKSILLGQKSCETKDLFSSNPQLMTVSINVNGSLKLSIVITWNPLDGVDENVVYIETPMRPQSTPRRRPVSVIAINGQNTDQGQCEYERRHSNPASMQQTRDDNFILRANMSPSHTNNLSSYHGLDSPHVGSRASDHLPDAYHYTQLGPLYSQSVGNNLGGYSSSPALYRESDSQFPKQPMPVNQRSVLSSSLPPVISHLHFPSVSLRGLNGSRDSDSAVSNIEDVIHNLSSALEDYHGQYAELNRLEELVKLANKLLRKQFRNSSRSSSMSVSIEDALEAFDFLNTEETTEEPQSPAINNTKSTFEDILCSPDSTAKTADSGIESLAQRLSEDTQLGSSLGSSPVPPSLGNEEVDQCLMYHLTYCERLLENLGAFGPLKCREIYALDKLQKQSTIIESLLKLAKSGSQVDLHSVMSTLCDNKALREFWVKCTDHNSLYVSPDRLILSLEQKFASVISEQHQMDPSKVCQHVITRILDIPDYEAEQGRPHFVITLHQFMLYFSDEGGLKHVENVADELKLVEKLMSGNSDMVIKAILTLRDSIPSAPCLKVIGMLLVTLDKEVEQCTISYLSLIQKKKENRDRAMVVFVEGLEDRTSEIRAGACAALAILEATESIDQLVYIWQSDSSQLVQAKAKEALQSMGEEGSRAFEEAQLSRHGFQGIQVQKGAITS